MTYSKSDYARTVAATIAYFLSTQHNAVGLLTFEERITQYCRPDTGRAISASLLAALEREPQGCAPR